MLRFTKEKINQQDRTPVGFMVVLFYKNISYHHSKPVTTIKDAEDIVTQWTKEGIIFIVPEGHNSFEIVPLYV